MGQDYPQPSNEAPELNPLSRILALARSQGVSTESALASALGLPTSLVHQMCQELERAGYLRLGPEAGTETAAPRSCPAKMKSCTGCQMIRVCSVRAPADETWQAAPFGRGD